MAERLEDIEQVIRFIYTLDASTLEAVNRTTQQRIAQLEDRVVQSAEQANDRRGQAARQAGAQRVQDAKASMQQELSAFDEMVQEEISALDDALREQRRIRQEALETQRNFERTSGQAAGEETLRQQQHQIQVAREAALRIEEIERHKARVVREERERTARSAEAAMTPAQIAERQEADKKTADDAAKQARLTAEDAPFDVRSPYQSMRRKMRRNLREFGEDMRGLGQTHSVRRQARSQSLVGQMFSQALGLKIPGASAEVSSAQGILGEIGKSLAGMANPISALVNITSGIKDIAFRMYERSIANHLEQQKMVAGSPELIRRAIAENQERGQGMFMQRQSEALLDAIRHRGGEGALRVEEQKDVATIVDQALRTSPRISGSDPVQVERVHDVVRTVSRQTGIDATKLSEQIGDLARRQGSGDLASFVDAASQFQRVAITSMKQALEQGVSSDKLIKGILSIHDAMLPFGMTLDQAAGFVSKFAKEIDRGTLSVQAIQEAQMGGIKADTGTLAFLADRIADTPAAQAQTEGFADLRELLKQTTSGAERGTLLRILQEGGNVETLRQTRFGEQLFRGRTPEEAQRISEQLQQQAKGATQAAALRAYEPIMGGGKDKELLRQYLLAEGLIPTLEATKEAKTADARGKLVEAVTQPEKVAQSWTDLVGASGKLLGSITGLTDAMQKLSVSFGDQLSSMLKRAEDKGIHDFVTRTVVAGHLETRGRGDRPAAESVPAWNQQTRSPGEKTLPVLQPATPVQSAVQGQMTAPPAPVNAGAGVLSLPQIGPLKIDAMFDVRAADKLSSKLADVIRDRLENMPPMTLAESAHSLITSMVQQNKEFQDQLTQFQQSKAKVQ